MPGVLADRRILLTRPAGESQALCERLREMGAVPVLFPALQIEPVWHETLPALLRRALVADFIVFISPSAVQSCSLALERAAIPFQPAARPVAIGPGTAQALLRQGVKGALVPAGSFDSEGVAALPELADVAGRRVSIVCGVGGRRALGEALTARGAAVEHVECYRRAKPQGDVEDLVGRWESEGMAAALITSSEGLRNLWELVDEDGRRLWRATPTFVPHPRVEAAARELGLSRVVVAGPGDETMLAALLDFFR
jgi:uroporphyrinogen-III synthase